MSPLSHWSGQQQHLLQWLEALGAQEMQWAQALDYRPQREVKKKVREKSRECHNHKLQPFPDTKRKRKLTNLNKHKSNKCMKSTKISSLFPKRGNRNAKKTEKHKNKITQGKT